MASCSSPLMIPHVAPVAGQKTKTKQIKTACLQFGGEKPLETQLLILRFPKTIPHFPKNSLSRPLPPFIPSKETYPKYKAKEIRVELISLWGLSLNGNVFFSLLNEAKNVPKSYVQRMLTSLRSLTPLGELITT